MNAQSAVEQGRQILDPVLQAYGFDFRIGASGSSSGGDYVQFEYVRGDRRLSCTSATRLALSRTMLVKRH
jgi:hypothetical protein